MTSKSFYEGTATDDYLQVILTDEEDVPEAIGKLRVIYPNIMKLTYDNTRTRTHQMIDGAADVEQKLDRLFIMRLLISNLFKDCMMFI